MSNIGILQRGNKYAMKSKTNSIYMLISPWFLVGNPPDTQSSTYALLGNLQHHQQHLFGIKLFPMHLTNIYDNDPVGDNLALNTITTSPTTDMTSSERKLFGVNPVLSYQFPMEAVLHVGSFTFFGRNQWDLFHIQWISTVSLKAKKFTWIIRIRALSKHGCFRWYLDQ